VNVTANCQNCDAPLKGQYCHECGQKVPLANPTLGEFLSGATAELTDWDGKIPSTLKTLLFKPGRLTLDFFEGKRARWLPPLRLYLICSIAYFLAGPAVEAINHRAARQTARFRMTATDSSQVTQEMREQIDASPVARLLGKKNVERILADPAAFQRDFNRNYPKAMFVLLPLFALLTNVVYRRAAFRYPAHLYFALHLHAAVFAGLAITNAATVVGGNAWLAITGMLGIGYMLWYALRSARVVFGGTVVSTFGRLAVVGTVYWVFFLLSTVALIGLTSVPT
jgi:hypothetical protein